MKMKSSQRIVAILLAIMTIAFISPVAIAQQLERLPYNHPGLVVDLGVGLWSWPLPMDYDGDGDLDLLVSCPDKPYNGVYFFENPGVKTQKKMPVFKPGVRLGAALVNVGLSHVDGKPRVLVPGFEVTGFRRGETFGERAKIHPKSNVCHRDGKIRANQWKLADYDGDGALDLIVGVEFWGDYGWDDAWNENGQWTNGPLRGYVYLLRNTGTNAAPRYDEPRSLQAGGANIDVFGMPSPNLADFDGDGDLDLLCGEFLDGFTYFRNDGTRKEPRYAKGMRLAPRMDLQMIVPVAVDWDGDGDVDLIVGDEDGRVALVEHTGKVVDGAPVFASPVYFQQEAAEVKFGALATPVGVDWDEDGDDDILCGNTAGHIAFIENLGAVEGKSTPRWAKPRLLEAEGKTIRIMAGPNGSIQGPCEAKWGYTTLTAADWDGDGLRDLIVNSIWGKVLWHRNIGGKGKPVLAAAAAIEVEWEGTAPRPAWTWWSPRGKELVTQWRTTPVAVDFNRDGLMDLVMLDTEGYLCLYPREKRGEKLALLPPRRIFVDEKGDALRLNDKRAGGSGRRKLAVVDIDGDGRLDLLANSTNAELYRNTGEKDGKVVLKLIGNMDPRSIAGHTTSPTVIDLNRNGKLDLLVGAEDGYLYYKADVGR